MPSTTNPWTRTRSDKIRRLSRRPVSLAAAFLLALTAVIVPASTATATTIDAACAGTFTRTFSPAVTNTSQMVTVTENSTYNTCLVGPTATGTQTLTLPLACVTLSAGPATSETLTWDTGGTSTITWAAPTIAGQTVVFNGTVDAGRYIGATATKVTSGVSYFFVVLGCLAGTPVSSTTGLVDSLLLTH